MKTTSLFRLVALVLHGSSDSFWGSSMKIVTMQRRVACILCRDDAHKSISDTRCPSQKHHVIYLCFFCPANHALSISLVHSLQMSSRGRLSKSL